MTDEVQRLSAECVAAASELQSSLELAVSARTRFDATWRQLWDSLPSHVRQRASGRAGELEGFEQFIHALRGRNPAFLETGAPIELPGDFLQKVQARHRELLDLVAADSFPPAA